MRLHELHKPKEIDQFRQKYDAGGPYFNSDQYNLQDAIADKMLAHGFSYAGEGSFSTVFVNPDYPFALKIFVDDQQYIRWFNFCKQHQNNPFVPKLRGRVVRVIPDAGVYAARIEKLEEYEGEDVNPDSQFFISMLMKVYDKTSSSFSKKIKWEKFTGYNDHIDTIIAELSSAPRRTLDTHEGNIMLRGDQAVLIDPYYSDIS